MASVRAEAALLTAERDVADFYESVATSDATDRARVAANWIVNDLTGLQRARGFPPDRLPVTAQQLQDLLEALDAGKLSGRGAKEFCRSWARESRRWLLPPDSTCSCSARKRSFATRCWKPWRRFRAQCETYQSGKTAAIGRLIGETIRRTGGRASPDQVRRVLEEELSSPVSGPGRRH